MSLFFTRRFFCRIGVHRLNGECPEAQKAFTVGTYDELLLFDNADPFGFDPYGVEFFPAIRTLWNHLARRIIYFDAFKIENTHWISPFCFFIVFSISHYVWLLLPETATISVTRPYYSLFPVTLTPYPAFSSRIVGWKKFSRVVFGEIFYLQ